MVVRTREIRRALRTASQLDQEWIGKIAAAGDPKHTPWMPFPIREYVSLLAAAVEHSDGDKFLEIGCGPGSKMLLARDIFGLNVYGIERVPEYVAQARDFNMPVSLMDAYGWGAYGDYDIIWFNRPFRDRERQAALEQQVWTDTSPGTVVMCANLENRPPSSWLIVDDSWEDRQGAWQKPYRP